MYSDRSADGRVRGHEGVVATAAGLVPPFALVVPVWRGARGLVCSLPLDFGCWMTGGRRGMLVRIRILEELGEVLGEVVGKCE